MEEYSTLKTEMGELKIEKASFRANLSVDGEKRRELGSRLLKNGNAIAQLATLIKIHL